MKSKCELLTTHYSVTIASNDVKKNYFAEQIFLPSRVGIFIFYERMMNSLR